MKTSDKDDPNEVVSVKALSPYSNTMYFMNYYS